MKIDNVEFKRAIAAMKANPDDEKISEVYHTYLYKISEIVAKKYIGGRNHVMSIPDCAGDIFIRLASYRIYNRVDLNGSPFSYYYTTAWRHLHSLYDKSMREPALYASSELDYERLSKEEEDEEEMMFRFLDWDIEVVRVDKPRRGHPPKDKTANIAKHWVYIYKTLKKRKTMTFAAAEKMVPVDKLVGMKNPSKNIEYYLRKLAGSEGNNIRVSRIDGEVTFMLVESNE